MRMSYKRAWQLVDELNGLFDMPLVAASKGGSGGGGAALTKARRRRTHALPAHARGMLRGDREDLAALHRHRSSAAESAKKKSARGNL